VGNLWKKIVIDNGIMNNRIVHHTKTIEHIKGHERRWGGNCI
jgi:hypothetical protein